MLTFAGGDRGYQLVLLWWPLCYGIAALLLWRRHRATLAEEAPAA